MKKGRLITGPTGYVAMLQDRLSVSRFVAAIEHDRNQIAENAAGEHAHKELNRW